MYTHQTSVIFNYFSYMQVYNQNVQHDIYEQHDNAMKSIQFNLGECI